MQGANSFFSWAGKGTGLVALALALLLLAGCATRQQQEIAMQTGVVDPLEPLNRSLFDLHQTIDRMALEPVARGYRRIPAPITRATANFFRNLEQPVVAVNEILQGKPRRASESLERFLTNSLLGVCGLFDAASATGIPLYDEDFGQTLAVWGIGETPYLFLPLLGPMNLRDGLGRVVDTQLEPGGRIINSDTYDNLRTAGAVTLALDWRAKNLENIDRLQRASLDLYVTLRSIYQQQRQAAILDGAEVDLPPAKPGGDAADEDIFEKDYGL